MDKNVQEILCDEFEWKKCPPDAARFTFYLFADCVQPEV